MDVLPVSADSTVLLYTNVLRRHEGDPQKHLFTLFDHRLRARWQVAVRLPTGAECISLAAAAGVRLVLCALRADDRSLLVVRLATADGTATLLHYRLPAVVRPLRLEATPEAAYVVAQAYQQQTVLRLPLRDSAAVEFLSTFANTTSTISDVLPDAAGLHVLVGERTAQGGPGTGRVLMRSFPRNGALPAPPRILHGPELISLTAGRLSELLSPLTTSRLLVGTYASHDPRYVQGLFTTMLPAAGTGNEEAPVPIRYYDLPTLPHFYDRFNQRHRARAAARAVARRRAGLETVSRVRLLLHRPLPTPDGGYVVVAEQYYPRYRAGDVWGYRSLLYRPYAYSSPLLPFAYGLPGLYGPYDPLNVWDRGLDGYVFTQALVCAFTADGRIRWQQSVVFDGGGLVRFDLSEQLAVTVLGLGADGALRVGAALTDGEVLRHTVVSADQPGPAHLPRTPLRLGLAADEKLPRYRRRHRAALAAGRLLLCSFQRVSRKGREALVLSELGF